MVVVLPAPFGPRRPKTSPGAISKEIPSTACTAPKLTRSSEQVTGSAAPEGTVRGADATSAGMGDPGRGRGRGR